MVFWGFVDDILRNLPGAHYCYFGYHFDGFGDCDFGNHLGYRHYAFVREMAWASFVELHGSEK